MAAADGLSGISAPIKLLYILDEFATPLAGTESQFLLLLQGLDRDRVDPAILLLRPSKFLQDAAGTVPVRVLNVTRLRSIVGIVRVLCATWWARRCGFRLAHIFFNDSTLVFPMPLKLAGLKVIVSRRDLGFWYTRAKLSVLRLQARFVDAVVANCEAVRRIVLESERVRPDRVRVIYNGVARKPGAAADVNRSALGVPEDAALIVVVANLRPLKRVEDAVRALARLRGHRRQAHLIVVGEDREGASGDSHRVELEGLAQQLGVWSQVHFAGKMIDPMPVIALADVCILCSQTEGLSNVIVEYMIAGKPIVCTDVGGNPELVTHGETGYLVQPADDAELANAISSLLEEPVRASAFGKAAERRASELFTPEAMVEYHMALYEKLLKNTEPTRPR